MLQLQAEARVIKTGTFNLTFTSSSPTSQSIAVNFEEAFDSVPYIELTAAAITGNTVVAVSSFSKTASGFHAIGYVSTGGTTNTTVPVDYVAVL